MKLEFLLGVFVICCDAAKISQKFKISADFGNSVESNEVLRIPSHEIGPYLAAIYINNMVWCSGVIVDPRWVLTAAHCFNYVFTVDKVAEVFSRTVKVLVLTDDLQQFQEIVVTDVVRHPAFEVLAPPHGDVAMLRLQRPVTTSYTVSRSIELYNGFREPFYQSFVAVTGLAARNSRDEPGLNTAHGNIVRLKVRTHQYCIDSYQINGTFLFTKEFFCASYSSGVKDTCMFDAGAPAVQNGQLMGIMLFGPEKCGTSQPPVFIKTFFFKGFVTNTVVNYRDPKTTAATTDISITKVPNLAFSEMDTTTVNPTFSDESETFPDKSEPFPDESKTFPDESGTFPDESETFPDDSGTFPDESETFPHDSEISPDESEIFPDDSKTLPHESVTFSEEKEITEAPTSIEDLITTEDAATIEASTISDETTSIEAGKTSNTLMSIEGSNTPDETTTIETEKTSGEAISVESKKKPVYAIITKEENTTKAATNTVEETTKEEISTEEATTLDEATTIEGATNPDEATTIEVVTNPDEAKTIDVPISPDEATTIEVPTSPDEATTIEVTTSPDEVTTIEAAKTPNEATTMEVTKSSDEEITVEVSKPSDDPTNLEEVKPTDKVASTIGATITDDSDDMSFYQID